MTKNRKIEILEKENQELRSKLENHSTEEIRELINRYEQQQRELYVDLAKQKLELRQQAKQIVKLSKRSKLKVKFRAFLLKWKYRLFR